MAAKNAVAKSWDLPVAWNGRRYSDPAKVPGEPAGSPLFEDDFSSADMSKYNAYFRWGTGFIPTPGTGASSISSVIGPRGTTINARRMTYGTSGGGSEQRFAFTTAIDEVRTTDGNSNTAYQEICLAYDFFIPANYVHTADQPNVEGAANNKWWAAIWKDQYGHSAQLSKVWASIEAWPTSADPGKSMARLMWSDPGPGIPNTFSPSYIAPSRAIPSTSNAYAVKGSDIGKWARIMMHFRCSDIGQTNGFMRFYRAEYSAGVLGAYELMFARENMDNSTNVPLSPETNGFDRGYLIGYCNSKYPESTIFYIGNVAFGIEPSDLGVAV